MESELKQRVAEWARDNPEGAAALREEGAAQARAALEASHRQALADATAEGAWRERERVAAIRETVPPGFDALAEKLIANGSTPDQAAHAVCAAVKEQGAAAAQANAAGAVKPLEFVAAPSGEEEAVGRISGLIGSDADDRRLAAAAETYQAQHPGTTFVEALQLVSQGVN